MTIFAGSDHGCPSMSFSLVLLMDGVFFIFPFGKGYFPKLVLGPLPCSLWSFGRCLWKLIQTQSGASEDFHGVIRRELKVTLLVLYFGLILSTEQVCN